LPVCVLMWLPSQPVSGIGTNDKGKFNDDRQRKAGMGGFAKRTC